MKRLALVMAVLGLVFASVVFGGRAQAGPLMDAQCDDGRNMALTSWLHPVRGSSDQLQWGVSMHCVSYYSGLSLRGDVERLAPKAARVANAGTSCFGCSDLRIETTAGGRDGLYQVRAQGQTFDNTKLKVETTCWLVQKGSVVEVPCPTVFLPFIH